MLLVVFFLFSFSWDEFLAQRSRLNVPFSDLDRFNRFVNHHRAKSIRLSHNLTDYVPFILRGGPEAGPIARGPNNQIVRILGAYPGLTQAKPTHSVDSRFQSDDLSWVWSLVSHNEEILEELNAQLLDATESLRWSFFATPLGEKFSENTGWAHILLIDNYSWIDDNCAKFPVTVRALRECVGTARRLGPRHVAIARQKARSGIPDHSDLINSMLTLHLPLCGVGVSAGITINGTFYEWRVNEPIVMDTTFVHSTRNSHPTDDVYMLLVDFHHPDLTNCEIDALRAFWSENGRG